MIKRRQGSPSLSGLCSQLSPRDWAVLAYDQVQKQSGGKMDCKWNIFNLKPMIS